VVHLRQEVAAPVLVRAWSRSVGAAGANANDYALYIDINFHDNTHEWAFALPFDKGTHHWQVGASMPPNSESKSLRQVAGHYCLAGQVMSHFCSFC
jgi:hypothetical protein